MSLIDDMMEDCVIMNKSRVSDGEGGTITTWTEGAPIKAAIVADSSMQSRIAQKEGVTSTYTITTRKETELDFHEVIKRVKDAKTFRVTSWQEDKVSPTVSGLDMAQVTAERWDLTT